jgi:2-polyprenyl-3-methyl-5-hydroxy-6-metoxy-1,4-benzoquinol methylase
MKSYDVVVCNHVLEHIENDRKAVKNLMALVNDDGICQITVPTPAYKKKTEEYGFANEKYSYHYRCFCKASTILGFEQYVQIKQNDRKHDVGAYRNKFVTVKIFQTPILA